MTQSTYTHPTYGEGTVIGHMHGALVVRFDNPPGMQKLAPGTKRSGVVPTVVIEEGEKE